MLLSILKIQIKKIIIYKESVVSNIFFSLIAVYIMFSLYSLLPNEHYNQKYILCYVFISVFFEQCIASNRIPLFCKNIKKGIVAKYYKYPIPIYRQFIYDEMGETFFGVLNCCPLLIITICCINKNIVQICWFILSLVLSLIISILLTLDVFNVTFLFWNYKSSKAILTAVCSFFSGAMIPLILLPDWFVKVAYYTPFSYIVDYPIHVLLDDKIRFSGFIYQSIWVIVLYILGILLYKINESKMNIYGG